MASKSGLRPQALDFERAQWSAGLDLDLPLDRKAERNNYRASLIGYERTRRELELAVDQIKLDVNRGWRALDQARRNYDIADVGVTLSQRRVEEQELRMELDEGTTDWI
jgi:outer membrane protein TolC